MITIYTVTYNEELMLPHFIRHYRERFPHCRIIVYDNYSTDATVRIALSAGCEVIYYDTNHQLDDMKYLEIKNHCWQKQDEDYRWAMVVDCDELCDITADKLLTQEVRGTTIIKFQGYDMVNPNNDLDVHNITTGVKNDRYSKSYCFNTTAIKEINYAPGCHDASPVGDIVYSAESYPCYHYRYISPAYLSKRYAQNKARMCENNRRKGMGSQYFQNDIQINNEFHQLRAQAQPIREVMPTDVLKIFVAGYDDMQFQRVPLGKHLVNTNLSNLQIGALQDNRLSEHRLFLSDAIESMPCDYTGILTWRWYQKCRHMIPLDQTWQLYRDPSIIWAAWPAANWYRTSCIDHQGLQLYLDELIEFAGLQSEGTGLYANQFICSKEVYLDFQAFFRRCFDFFHSKYGYNYKFWVKEGDKNRLPAVFYERISCLYFANRRDLTIKQIPFK